MIFFDLLKQNRFKTLRSSGFSKNLAFNIFFLLLGLYFAAIFLIVGIALYPALLESGSEYSPIELINNCMLYFILISVMIRFFTQQLATVNIQLYQTLPIKRSGLVNYILIRPIFNPINYLIMFMIIPFAVMASSDYPALVSVNVIISFLLIIWFDSLLGSYLKRKFGTSLWGIIALVGICAIIVALETFEIFSLSKVSGIIFNFVIFNRFGPLLILIAVVLAFLLNKLYFRKNFYVEQFDKHVSKERYNKSQLTVLERFGEIGNIMSNEIKLFLRHKRTKAIVYMSAFFMLYGLIFYAPKNLGFSESKTLLASIIITAMLMSCVGQWIFSWDSSNFDGLMTVKMPIKSYVTANLRLLQLCSILSFIVSTPYFLFGKTVILNQTACFLINLGITPYLMTFFGTYNTERIDLTKSSAFNFQGTTLKNFIIVIPVLLLPLIIVALLKIFVNNDIAVMIMGAIGILGLLFDKRLVKLCVSQFNKRKYTLCEGFREKE